VSVYFVTFCMGLPGVLGATLTNSQVLVWVCVLLNPVIDALFVYWIASTNGLWQLILYYFGYLLLTRYVAFIVLGTFIAMHT